MFNSFAAVVLERTKMKEPAKVKLQSENTPVKYFKKSFLNCYSKIVDFFIHAWFYRILFSMK